MAVQIRSSWVIAWLAILIGILTTNSKFNAIEKVHAAAAKPQTLTGARAQKSPQADVFLPYEKALLNDGIAATSVYITAERLANVQQVLKQFGPDSWKSGKGRV